VSGISLGPDTCSKCGTYTNVEIRTKLCRQCYKGLIDEMMKMYNQYEFIDKEKPWIVSTNYGGGNE
jgi:hypothetical protein